ncbi:hypothetical protein, partial [Pseudomonas edaphica]|uniref:hypothetical protein n=1 Tax=Pseudomonas edaphica TaxID=2006980 RepID=UPI001C432EC3
MNHHESSAEGRRIRHNGFLGKSKIEAWTLALKAVAGCNRETLDTLRAHAFRPPKTKPHLLSQMGFRNLILTMTYSHMGKPHTTIGDASFHY